MLKYFRKRKTAKEAARLAKQAAREKSLAELHAMQSGGNMGKFQSLKMWMFSPSEAWNATTNF